MPCNQDLLEFNRNNRTAVKFADKATDDYLLARLGFQQALCSACEVATQAVEKFLKAYLLFRDPSLAGSAEIVRKAVERTARGLGRKKERGHDVEAALDLSIIWQLPCSNDLRMRLNRINSYYDLRYPDSGGPTALGSSEIRDIDEAVFEIWDAFEAVNADYYHACGLMRPIYGHFIHVKNPLAAHFFNVMTSNNQSWENRRYRLEHGIGERLLKWYLKTDASVC